MTAPLLQTLRKGPTLTIGLIALCSLVVLLVFQPWYLVAANTPTGGDMGAHVFAPAYLRDVLLPQGRLMGWSQDWFAGFPVFYFYFPLPSLTIVLLDLVLPYGVAFKLVTTLGLLAMPFAVYFHSRAIRLGKTVALVTAGAAPVFIFFESFSIYGGNMASTLAGEFSFAWSFSLSLVYLGLLVKAVADDRRYLKWAALALAATALTHVLTTIVAVFASLFVMGWRKGVARTLLVWVWGFSVAAFWALPLFARIGLTSDMGWNPLSRWEEVFPIEMWLLLSLAIPGAIWAMRTTRRAGPMIGATLLPLIYFPLPNILPELLPSVFDGERWKLWNGRLLPYWYFGICFFAAVALGAAVVWMSRRLPQRTTTHLVRAAIIVVGTVAAGLVAVAAKAPAWAWIPVAVAGIALLGLTLLMPPTVDTKQFLVVSALALLVLGAASSVTYVDGWARWNYTGYEAKEPWPEYEALMMELDRLPPGRVMWESNSELNKYGTPMAPMLIPYWTEGSHQSMEGLFFESSITTPFHFINHSEMSYRSSNPIPGLIYHTFDMERGLRHMDVYGVDYYVSFTPEAAEKAAGIEGFELLTTVEPFSIFRLPETDLVEVLSHQPAVYPAPERGVFASLIGSETVTTAEGEPLKSFHDMALEWYEDIDEMDLVVTAGGPDDWPRIETLDERPDLALDASGSVSDIVVDDHRISFRTEAVGVPHMVKVSYFPNWTATGAEGPWRATPSLMVIVPTETEVVLEFTDTWAETLGKLLTVVGLGAVVVVSLLWSRRAGSTTVGSGTDRSRSEALS
ncbi:MAG: hypothetical protein L0Z47_00215 [Actinobacteria bacterium]|nr:hypothetical protein [Actinomycetota bacterium]